MRKKNAFTLVELLVSVSLAIVLMTSISLFVTDWVKNITQQKNIVDNNSEFFSFEAAFFEAFNSTNKYLMGFINPNWALFKIDKNYSAGWFTYIWEQAFTWLYCSWTDNDMTNHFIMKSFVPFESVIWMGDIFDSDYNYDDWTYKTSYFSWIITSGSNIFTGTYIWPSDILINWNDLYVSDTLNHTVLKFDKTNPNTIPVIVAWKSSIYWNDLKTLNNPTWITFWDNKLFISDTLNDRILYISGWLAYELLNREDWLREPTWLYYNNSRNSLFISNSAAWEILEYRSFKYISNPSLYVVFNPEVNVNWVSDIILNFYNSSLSAQTITWNPSFSFTNISNTVWLASTWTSLKYTFSTVNNFLSWNNYSVSLSSISPYLSSTWNYFVNMTLSWSNTWTQNFSYFTQWDNDLTTKSDNTLKIITWSLFYPTWIKFDWTNLVISDFLDRQLKTIDLNWNLISSSALKSFNFNLLPYNKYSDALFKIPIKTLDFNFDNNLFSINLGYFKNYSCNNSKDNITKNYIFKKYIK